MGKVEINKKEYRFSEKELRNIQLTELEMLLEVDRICKIADIKYCISAGTQLGAIRHKGFIPWDDDADIALLRGEYERFKEVCKKELDNERFYFQDQEDTPGYRWGYAKLRRKGTEFIRLNQEFMPYEQGIFIDIMPYDFVPDFIISRKIHALKCFIYRKYFWSFVGRESAKGFEKIIYRIISGIPYEKVLKNYQKFIRKSNRKETNRVRNLALPVPGNQNGYPSECFKNTEPILFEGYILKGMKYYDKYLSYKYGNYMELPPSNQRKIHPVSKLKLIEKNNKINNN